MSILRKLDPHLFERNHKEVIISLVNYVGFLVFFIFGIDAIVAHCEENKDGPHDNSQLSFVACTSAVAMQTAFLFIETMWNLESIMCKVALASLSFETVGLFILSHVINFDKEHQTHLALVQYILPATVFIRTMILLTSEERKIFPTSVLAGSSELLTSEEGKKKLNRVGKRYIDERIKLLEGGKRNIDNRKTDDRTKLLEGGKRNIDNKKTDDRIKLLEGEKRNLELELLESKKENEKLAVKLKETQESMEDEIKALTKQSKVMEAEKKKLELDLAVKREREDTQKDNNVPKKDFEALSTAHSLQADKLRKMEEEALRMKVEIRVLKELHEYDYSKWGKNVETIAMLTYKNERREIEVNKMEKNCVDLQKNFDDMRKNRISFQEVGKKAFGDAEQALGELVRSVLLLQQQR